MVRVFISYGMGYYSLTSTPPDDAVRVWLLPYDITTWEIAALVIMEEDDTLEYLSTVVEISSN
jgi:hypothetical protein